MFVESVSNADEQLGEMFLEEKTPTMDDIHVSSHLYFFQMYKECVIFDRPWLSVCAYLYIRERDISTGWVLSAFLACCTMNYL